MDDGERDDERTGAPPSDSDARASGERDDDATERERRERRYSAIFNDPNILVGLTDTEGRVLDINETALEYVDASVEDVVGVPFAETPWFDRSDMDRETVEEWIARAADGEYVDFGGTHYRPNGEPYVVDGVFRPVTDEDGTVVSIIVSAREVTEQKRHERRLEALNERTGELVSAETREAAAERGVEAAEEILGLEANSIHLYDGSTGKLEPVAQTDAGFELVGEPPSFTPDESIAWRVYESGDALALDDVHDDPDVFNRETAVHSELYLPIGDHGILLASSTTPKAFDESDVALGELLAGNVATALDQIAQTERLRARERELTRQNERLEEFASIASHDLRNPLNVAQGRVELARETCDDENLLHATRALERMEQLIDDLLDLARQGESISETEPVPLGELAHECWDTVEMGPATLQVETYAVVEADRSRLQQLFENLFRNSVEHGTTADTEGGVTVTVGALDGGFYVADDGPGVPAEKREEVFEAGYTTAANGTGFGLAIVKEIAAAHGWEVAMTESESGGARVEVTGVQVART